MAMHFDLVDLRLMIRVAEANSLTRGAEAVYMSVPTASTRIKNIEDSIGIKLFYRTSQGVTLTLPGQAFVHHARLVLGQLEHLSGDLQEYAKGIKGHLRVFANTTALGEFLPPVLRAYLLAHPAGTVRTENLEVIPYRRDRLVLVVPRDHPMAALPSVAFVDTLELEHIGLHESSAIHAFLRQICSGLHRTIRLRIQVGNFEAACRMIEATVGVSVLPESAARRHAETMAIQIVPLIDDWSLRAMQICVRSMESLPPFARDLVTLLIEDARMASEATAD